MADNKEYGAFLSYNYNDNVKLNYSKIDAEYVESVIEEKDKYLEGGKYNKDTNQIVFAIRTSDDSYTTTSVDVSELANSYSAGEGITISEDGTISCTIDDVDLTGLKEAVESKQNALTAGDNVSISDDVISVSELDCGTY